MEGGGNDVVRGLAQVDVIVRVHDAARAGKDRGGPVGHHLVGVHVRRGARTGLEHVEREMRIESAVGDLLRRLRNRIGHLRVQQSELAIHLRRGLLDQSHRAEEPARKTDPADRKIDHGPLRRGAVVGLLWYFHLTHRVALHASRRIRHGRSSSMVP